MLTKTLAVTYAATAVLAGAPAPPPPPPPMAKLADEPPRVVHAAPRVDAGSSQGRPVNRHGREMLHGRDESNDHAPIDGPSSIHSHEDHDEYFSRKRRVLVEEHPEMKKAGHHYMKGVWLYGGYKDHVEGIDSALGCADGCEADEKCYHWVFEVDQHQCSYRGNHGGHNADQANWVTGHSKRYLEAKAVEAKPKGPEL